jgi:DHA1 family inner membrane transport protein
MMFGGLTLANVLGVPLGTALGQWTGWRSTFGFVAGLGVLAMVGIAALVPRGGRSERTDLRAQIAVFRRSRVWLALACTAFGFGGVFAAFTYVTPMLTGVAGFSNGAVSWLLVIFGVGLCVGNVVGGRSADRALMPSTYAVLGSLVAVLVLFAVLLHWQIAAAITLFVFGMVGFATVPLLQSRVLQQASDAPALASAANISAFNIGNAVGAAVSGWALAAGWNTVSPNLIGAAFTAVALVLAVVSGRLDRRELALGPEAERIPEQAEALSNPEIG